MITVYTANQPYGLLHRLYLHDPDSFMESLDKFPNDTVLPFNFINKVIVLFQSNYCAHHQESTQNN
jgi:hypothetical protein